MKEDAFFNKELNVMRQQTIGYLVLQAEGTASAKTQG